MAGAAKILVLDEKTRQMVWVPNPNYRPEQESEAEAARDRQADIEESKHYDVESPSVFDPKSITSTPPLNRQALGFIDDAGRPLMGPRNMERGNPLNLEQQGTRGADGMIPNAPHASNIPILKSWSDPAGPGAAFDTGESVKYLLNKIATCGDHYGYCQRRVREALIQGGLDVPAFPSAKNMVGFLANNPKFAAVASGLGNNFYASTSSDYQPKIGDIMVYKGNDSSVGGQTGPHGHIQMCVGFRDGKAVWMSDFGTREGNMSGMRDPVGHGGEFVVFRQHSVNATATATPTIDPVAVAADLVAKKAAPTPTLSLRQ